MWPPQRSLKEIYFTPQNKTKTERKRGVGLGVHRECIDNCSLHFFGVSSEKNVNTVIIIALHKSRLMSASPHNCVSPATPPDLLFEIWEIEDRRSARPGDARLPSLESHKAMKHCGNLSAVHSRESHSLHKYFTALNLRRLNAPQPGGRRTGHDCLPFSLCWRGEK